MPDLIHRQESTIFKGKEAEGFGPSTCTECGWSGVPSFIDGEIQHDCPACTISNEQYLEDLKPRAPKQGRNEPCACGSGKKFKKCHGA